MVNWKHGCNASGIDGGELGRKSETRNISILILEIKILPVPVN